MKNKKFLVVLLLLILISVSLFAGEEKEKPTYPKKAFGITGDVSFLLGKNEDTFGDKNLTTAEVGLECEKWWSGFFGYSSSLKGSYAFKPFYKDEEDTKGGFGLGFGLSLNIKIPMGKHFAIVAKVGASLLERTEYKDLSDSSKTMFSLASLSGDATIVFRMTTGEYKGLYLDVGASGSCPFLNYSVNKTMGKMNDDTTDYNMTQTKKVEDFKGFFLSPYIALGFTF